MTSDAIETRDLVRRAIARATATPLPGYEGRTMAAVHRLRTAGHAATEGAGRRRAGRRGLVLSLVGAALVAVLGLSTALAEGGALSAGLAAKLEQIGLGKVANQFTPVEARATDAGITIHATAAYADSSVVGVAMHTDAAPATEKDYPVMPTLVGSTGQVLQQAPLYMAMDSANDVLIFFSPPAGAAVQGSDFTLTVHRVYRPLAKTVQGGEGSVDDQFVNGTWVLHLRVTPTVTQSTPIPAPAAGNIGAVHASFTNFHKSGAYLVGEVDLSAPTATAFAQALAMNVGGGLMVWMLQPGVPVPADDPLSTIGRGPSGSASPIYGNGLPPRAKGGPPANDVASHYEEHYVWPASKPGIYHLVIGAVPVGGVGGPWLVREIQVP